MDKSQKKDNTENYEEIEFLVLVYLKENKYQKTFESFMKECSKFTHNLFYSFFQQPNAENQSQSFPNEFNYTYQANKKKLKSLNYIITDYSALKKQTLLRTSFYSQLITPTPSSPYLFSPNSIDNSISSDSVPSNNHKEIGKIIKQNNNSNNSNTNLQNGDHNNSSSKTTKNIKLSTEKIDNTMKKLVDMIDDLYYYRTNLFSNNNQEEDSGNISDISILPVSQNNSNFISKSIDNKRKTKNDKIQPPKISNSNSILNNNNNNLVVNNNNNLYPHTNSQYNNNTTSNIKSSLNNAKSYEQKPISFDFSNLTPSRPSSLSSCFS